MCSDCVAKAHVILKNVKNGKRLGGAVKLSEKLLHRFLTGSYLYQTKLLKYPLMNRTAGGWLARIFYPSYRTQVSIASQLQAPSFKLLFLKARDGLTCVKKQHGFNQLRLPPAPQFSFFGGGGSRKQCGFQCQASNSFTGQKICSIPTSFLFMVNQKENRIFKC